MAKFEIWNTSSLDPHYKPVHIVEADNFEVTQGVYVFLNSIGEKLHAIVASPGMLIRKSDGKGA